MVVAAPAVPRPAMRVRRFISNAIKTSLTL
jgi:hypothetical protein